MKSAVLEDARKIVVKELPKPELQSHKILVKIEYCGICTLEQRLYTGDMKIYYPIVPGHEASGVVMEVGERAGTAFQVGDKVALDMVYRCNVCHFCRTGQSNLCENRFNKSVRPLGGFNEYILARPSQMHMVGKNLTLEEAAFTEPVACCIHSLTKLEVTLAEDVLIIGAGPMGLLHLQVARAMGARVFVSEINEDRLKTALELGADAVFNPAKSDVKAELKSLTAGRGVDACVVTSPAILALTSAFEGIRKGGRINIYTAYMGTTPELPIDLNTLHRSEILVTGTEGRTSEDFQMAARLLSHGRVKVKSLISRVVGYEDLAEGIEDSISPDTQRVLLGTGQ